MRRPRTSRRPAIRQAVEAAHNIARFTAEDDAAGLPDEDTLERHPRDVDLFHPWLLDTDEAIGLAQRCEAAAYAVSPRIVNSEGANVYTSSGHFVLANTRDFSRRLSVLAPFDLGVADRTGCERNAARRLVSRRRGCTPNWRRRSRSATMPHGVRWRGSGQESSPTRQCPVLFEAPLACGLLGNFAQAVSGGALYRKSSFLVDALGKQVFAPHISIEEDPYLPRGAGSSPFDEEGVRGLRRLVVKDGRLDGYFLSTYSARKLGMKSTGNAGGSYNLALRSSVTEDEDDFEVMLRRLGTGLLVTELIGQGVNYVTGDYSRGASGFWVERGEIRHAVEEVTIAGNLRQMFSNIVAVGTDTVVRGSKVSGSIVIEGMTVAGA